MFKKVLIANRGEIACRIERTLARLGIASVAVHSDADQNALHVKGAGEAVRIGPAPVKESYLNVDAILAAAKQTGADAIHPGYGLLSEKETFASAVRDAGITYIGPPSRALDAFGDKIKARAVARRAGVSPPPGTDGPVAPEDVDAITREADRIGYPILVKAAGGGGGIGMQIVESADKLARAVQACSDRGKSAFADARVYLERYVEAPRHIEVQVLCDQHGGRVALGERECSLQRRHQKIVEETPSPASFFAGDEGEARRKKLWADALAIVAEVGYEGAGTVEFVASPKGELFFLEVNARLQVEHCVTEMVTGIDLVEQQIKVALGEKLSPAVLTPTRRGHSIEARIYAEDPEKKFAPQPGHIEKLVWPPAFDEGVTHLRIETGVRPGDAVTRYSDPMIAKVVAHGADRDEARRRLDEALGATALELVGPQGKPAGTNLAFLRAVLGSSAFTEGQLRHDVRRGIRPAREGMTKGPTMDLETRARHWLSHDPDPNAKKELEGVLARVASGDEAAKKDLAERFSGPLDFGTAGLRGVIGAGESRMNRAVVRRTCLGLGKYLLENDPDVKTKGIAIGYDGRRLSREMAEDTACVLAAMEIRSYLSPHVCPTPVTAYATARLGASAGVMVTASHNPPEYNGYKVYWSNGAQIIPPHDTGIAAAIAKGPEADEVPLLSLDDGKKRGLIHDFPADLEPSYLDAVQALALQPNATFDRSAPIVYTALHGVGNRLVRITFDRARFTGVTSVPEQAEPDGEFPTVKFPNPEEKGALDLSYALANKLGADIVIANDPDVDRLAIAVRRPDSGFTQLTGNQVGVLLGHYVLTEGDPKGERAVLASCVSSPMLGAIARALGVHYEETLTGFKWIANRAIELEREKKARFVFGFEEALGYTVGDLVRDKDGISAALLFAELWAARRAKGITMLQELESLYRKYGLYTSGQVSLTMKGTDGVDKIHAMMDRLRKSPPAKVGDFAIVATSDVSTGVRKTSDGKETKLTLPPSDVLIYELKEGHRIIARPSGTEPKIKFYFDVRESVGEGDAMPAVEARASATMEALKKAFTAIAGG